MMLLLRRTPEFALFPYAALFRSPGAPWRRAPRTARRAGAPWARWRAPGDRKSTRLNSSHRCISYAVFGLKKKKNGRFAPCNRLQYPFVGLMAALLSVTTDVARKL